jgi:hypothetical protein
MRFGLKDSTPAGDRMGSHYHEEDSGMAFNLYEDPSDPPYDKNHFIVEDDDGCLFLLWKSSGSSAWDLRREYIGRKTALKTITGSEADRLRTSCKIPNSGHFRDPSKQRN